MWVIRFSWVSHSSRRKNRFSSSILWQKSQRWHPFSILVEPDSEVIVCDNSRRFSERTFIRMITKIITKVIAKGLPTTAGKSEFLIFPLITVD